MNEQTHNKTHNKHVTPRRTPGGREAESATHRVIAFERERGGYTLAPTLRKIVACLGIVSALAVIGCTVFLGIQYRNYARIVDDRLAGGYVMNRAGVYAAPRVLRPGAPMTPARLVECLRQADYVGESSSNIWNGTFTAETDKVLIKPRRGLSATNMHDGYEEVAVNFANNRIASITGDSATLTSYALEAELLTKDARVKTDSRTALTYKDIPPHLVQAILAIEDRRFFEHDGVDVRGVTRALWNNLRAEQNASDNTTTARRQGGSTITQQLVKNTYLTAERTLRRKFAEAMIAVALERRLSKEEIFALYCNEIHLGTRGGVIVRGVGQAARSFFGKELNDLTLAEAATIAGMIQSPRRYAPDARPEAAQARRDVVLDAMTASNFIAPHEAQAARAQQLAVAPADPATAPHAPYFLDYVNRLADKQLAAYTNGDDIPARINTTLDLDLQALAEQALANGLRRLESKVKSTRDASGEPRKLQGALVAIEPHTGHVVAMVGGTDYRTSQLNRATDARRQPGSVFKPFVYAAALERGISPLSTYADAPREFEYAHGARYRPANYGGSYSNTDVTMREALVRSLNVVAVDVALRAGLGNVKRTVKEFGLPQPETAYPSLALGATEATPLEIASAYTAFANRGRVMRPVLIDSLISTDGVDYSPTSGAPGQQVIRPTTAYVMTDMMAAVVERGTARAARGQLPNTAFAGKTGTSRDGWFVGYTPNLVCAVWVGYDDNEELGRTGGESALPVWTEFMKSAVELRPEVGGKNFERPSGITLVEIDRASGMLAAPACPHREQVALAATTVLACYEHAEPTPETLPSDDATLAYSDTAATPPTAIVVKDAPSLRAPAPAPTSAPQPVVASVSGSSVKIKPTTSAVAGDGRKMLVSDFRD